MQISDTKHISNNAYFRESVPACDAQCQAQQRTGLMYLYQSAEGHRWTNNTGWNDSSVHHCSWHGVYCCAAGTGAGQKYSAFGSIATGLQLTCTPSEGLDETDQPSIVAINLMRNNLQGKVPDPAMPAMARSLQALELRGNSITDVMPPSFSLLKKLGYLTLDENRIPGPVRDFFSWYPVLRHFSISNNLKTGVFPPSIVNATKLQFLDISNNAFSGEHMPQMQIQARGSWEAEVETRDSG